MFGIQNVPDGSSQVALNALKAELAKSSEVAAEFSPNDKEELITLLHPLQMQLLLRQSLLTFWKGRLERETGKQIVENKCSMHLGVNLRLAQVKATRTVDVADGEVNTEDASSNYDSDNYESSNGHDNESNDELESDCAESSHEFANNFGKQNCDIDLFVHELAKLTFRDS